jgi:RNA polymerase sigma-70 factor (ECF subfamily)
MHALALSRLSTATADRVVAPRRGVVSLSPPVKDYAALIGLIATRGDRAAFIALFDRLAPQIKAYALRLGASRDLAEDIAQETMLAIWRKAARFDPSRASAEAWVFTIARNLRIDALRKASVISAGVELPEAASPEPAADTMIGAAEFAARLRAALATLPAEQAEVIRLSFFDDRPHADIERTLGIPLGTVKSRLRLAMARLRAALGDLQ